MRAGAEHQHGKRKKENGERNVTICGGPGFSRFLRASSKASPRMYRFVYSSGGEHELFERSRGEGDDGSSLICESEAS